MAGDSITFSATSKDCHPLYHEKWWLQLFSGLPQAEHGKHVMYCGLTISAVPGMQQKKCSVELLMDCHEDISLTQLILCFLHYGAGVILCSACISLNLPRIMFLLSLATWQADWCVGYRHSLNCKDLSQYVTKHHDLWPCQAAARQTMHSWDVVNKRNPVHSH